MLIKRRKRKVVGLLAFGLAAVLAVSAYAFTAGNTVPTHRAGGGQAVVNGYTVSWTGTGDGYTWSADGTHMVSTQFTLDHNASDVQVALTNGAPAHADWTDCTKVAASPTNWTCTFPSPVLNAAGVQLTVAAVDNGVVTIAP